MPLKKSDILIGWVMDRRTAALSKDGPNIVIEHTEYKKISQEAS